VGCATCENRGEPIRDGRPDVTEANYRESLAPNGVMQRRELLADVKASVLQRERQTVRRRPSQPPHRSNRPSSSESARPPS
jgi:hypothetical protein